MTRPDLRLAPMALGSWAATLATLHGGWPVGLGCAVAGLVAVIALRIRRPQWQWILVGALLGIICGTAATWARLPARDAAELRELIAARATATVEMTVRDDPRRVAGVTGRAAMWVVPATLTDAGVRVVVLAQDPSWQALLPGQRLRAEVRFGPPRGGDLTAAVLSTSEAPRRRDPAPWVQRVAGGLRDGLQRACAPLPDLPGGLLPGLVVGDTRRMDPELEQQFRDAGLTHLTAVSGSNLAIVAGCVLLLARGLRIGPGWSAALAAVAMAGFVILARPSPSVLRAAAMGGICLIALAGGRSRAAMPALSATVPILLVIDPDLGGDAGFALSVLATGGLLLLAPPMRDALRRRRVPAGLAEALAVPTAAQLVCAPVVAGLSGTISLTAILANLLAVPAVAPATIGGVVAAALSAISPDAAAFVAWLAGWPAWWLVKVAQLGSGAPWALVPWPAGLAGALLLAGLTVVALLVVRRRKGRRIALVLILAALVGAAPMTLVAPGRSAWTVAMCDVGQGDATLLRTGTSAAVVVDAGPAPAAMRRCLDAWGIDQVPLLVVSHFHLDHIGGLAAVWRLNPGRLLVPAWTEPAQSREAVLRAAGESRVPVTMAMPGTKWTVGAVNLTVLPTTPVRGTRSDPNNNSVLLAVEVGGTRLVLLGDAEAEQQAQLRQCCPELTADVVKVAHHGSAFQDPGLMEMLRPRVALVSVGAGNGYGHPSQAVLAALRRQGCRVLRTDVDGDVAIAGSGGRLEVMLG